MDSKYCSGCDKYRPLNEFYKKPRHVQYAGSLAGYSHNCKVCDRLARKEYVKNNPDKCKNSDRAYRLNKYGLSTVDYNKIFNAQEGKCLGCERHQSEFKRRLVVDHCHKTGVVRGLLCIPCNLILGYARDNFEVLIRLVGYLRKSELADNNTNVVKVDFTKKAG